MSAWQFFGLVVLLMVMIPVSVEVAIRLRWREIRGMFDRALMHGGSIDTLRRAIQDDAEGAKEASAAAVEAVRLLKVKVDDHSLRLESLENHPILRRVGGAVRP